MITRPIELVVVHTSATPSNMDIGAADIDKWHKARNWSGIGYHHVIRRSGALERGRGLNEVGAHAYGYNRTSIGICLIGGLDENGNTMEGVETYEPEQLITLRGYLDTLGDLFPGAELAGHRDLSPDINGDGVIERWEWKKECPCFDVREWYGAERLG